MPQDLAALLTAIGTGLAFAIAAFTVWDRLARWRPIAWVAADGNRTHPVHWLHVKNPSPMTMLLTNVKARSEYFAVARDTSEEGILSAGMGRRVTALLDPGEDRKFRLVVSSEKSLKNGEKFVITISWKRGDMTWLPQMPRFVLTSAKNIREIGTFL